MNNSKFAYLPQSGEQWTLTNRPHWWQYTHMRLHPIQRYWWLWAHRCWSCTHWEAPRPPYAMWCLGWGSPGLDNGRTQKSLAPMCASWGWWSLEAQLWVKEEFKNIHIKYRLSPEVRSKVNRSCIHNHCKSLSTNLKDRLTSIDQCLGYFFTDVYSIWQMQLYILFYGS